MLYNDPFLGRYDSLVHFNEDKFYSECSEKLAPLVNTEGFGYLFRATKALCDVLSVKYTLGARARKAYQSGDRAELEKVLSDFAVAKEKLDDFRRAYYDEWFAEKKPEGYEVIDLRLGGLASRLETCGKRLSDYLSGKLALREAPAKKLLCCAGRGKDFLRKHRS